MNVMSNLYDPIYLLLSNKEKLKIITDIVDKNSKIFENFFTLLYSR